MAKSRLHELNDLGVAVWFDTLSRDLVASGTLARMMDEDAVTGVTSNPTIFQKALAEGNAYDEQLHAATGDAKDVFFHIAHTFGAHTNHSVELGGAGLKALDMSARRTISTMCAELGAEFALFECDDTTREFLKGGPDKPIAPAQGDADADYADVRTIDLADVTYYVGHETVIRRQDGQGLPAWQERMFAVMERNAEHVSDFFRLPNDQVVEIGRQVAI